MRISGIVLFVIIALTSCMTDSKKESKDQTAMVNSDSLVNEWNIRFNSDQPENIAEILATNVSMISGDEKFQGKDSVMINFVKARMPVISDLKATNEFHRTTDRMAFTAGPYTLTVNRKDGETFRAGGNFTFIWTKQEDSKFRIEYIHIESVAGR